MPKTAEKDADRERATESLKKLVPPGATVYTVVKHVARSGMMRRIAPIAVVKGKVVNLSHLASRALGWTWTDDGAVKVQGCGMDMAFHLVYQIAEAIYGDGYKLAHEHL